MITSRETVYAQHDSPDGYKVYDGKIRFTYPAVYIETEGRITNNSYSAKKI